MSQSKSHVVVIGAGISGLAAAHELSKHSSSVQVTVLEARNRLGGRLDTRHHLLSGPQGQEIPLDFGASWIHGIDPTNPVMPLAQASEAALVPTNTDVIFYRPGQQPLSEDESNHYWAVLWEIFGQAQDHSRANKSEISAQTSFRDWLNHYLKTRQSRDPRKPNFMSARELKIVPLLAQFWADENAIPLNKVSLKYMDAEILPPGDHCIMANGYDRILDTLCKDMGKDVDIRLEHVVDRIEYDESTVRISTNKGVFVADHVIVTLPLGVLKSNAVTFSPPLPQRKRQAIERLGFGTMVKVVLSFPQCFWPETKHFINFLPIPSSIPNPKLSRHLNKKQMEALTTYMNDLANYTSLMPIHGSPVLIAYATNESAEAFGKLTDQEAMQVLLCQLSHYFDVLVTNPEVNRPTSVFMTRWNSDPYARGSYTSIPIGAHQSDLAEFEIPVGARSAIVPPKMKNDRMTTGSKAATLYRKQYRKPGPLSPPLRRQVESSHHIPGEIQVDHIGGGRSHGPIRSRENSFHVFEGKGIQYPLSLHSHEDIWIGERAHAQVQALATHDDGFTTLASAPMLGDSNATTITASLAYDDLTGSQEDVLRRLYQLLNSHLSGGEDKKIGAGPVQMTEPENVMRMVAVDDPAEGRIHFAGEHTTPTSFASVHGALMTGQREACKILRKTL
ncbi:hypothetical protein EMPS_06721 [Entomortierella parvispora]|uniref:Amine oxidase domain-containing protein n=1 Tax=Entomortierella parvispora TaxID=205924 RepID=A0A9P3LXR0_9FUNG|nr:hypothetical protein EMPS_06721 [Entomortierella parvispora]